MDGLGLRVERGELYALLGRNGAGKTTALKCTVGLLRPSAGRVLVGGLDVERDGARARGLMGYVPDRPFLYEKLRGSEFIGFMAELYGCDRQRVEVRARHYLELFELDGWEDELVETYSYGMRQKLVLSSVFAREPEALIIDEPIVGLDPRAAKTLRELLLELVGEGRAILMSTHSVSVAEAVAHRIGIIQAGSLCAEGSLEELRAKAGLPGADLEDVFLALTRDGRPPRTVASS